LGQRICPGAATGSPPSGNGVLEEHEVTRRTSAER
jgi:hypothetical protein